jgi:hypothetical protein
MRVRWESFKSKKGGKSCSLRNFHAIKVLFYANIWLIIEGSKKIIHSALCPCWASLSLDADVLIKGMWMNRKKEIKSSKLSHMRYFSRRCPPGKYLFSSSSSFYLRRALFLLLMNTSYATLIVKSLFSRLSHISLCVWVAKQRNDSHASTYFLLSSSS